MLRRNLLLASLVAATASNLLLVTTVTVCFSLIKAPEAKARTRFDKSTQEPAQDNLKQGLDLIKAGNYESAIDSFKQAIYFSRNHYNPEAYKLLGLCYKATRQYSKAIEAFSTLLQQSTNPEPDARTDLAECYIITGDTTSARDQIIKAMSDEQGKGTARQRYALGELEEKLNNPGQALAFYDEAADEKPYYTDAAMAVGRMNVILKRYNEGLQTYRAILDHGPLYRKVNFVELYNNMAICFKSRGDHQGALDHWRLALESDPDSYDAHLGIATTLDEERHYSSAAKEYEAALRCMPEGKGQKDVIMRRLQYIESQLAPKEAAPVIKPSPQMRQEYEDGINKREQINNALPPPSKDSGF